MHRNSLSKLGLYTIIFERGVPVNSCVERDRGHEVCCLWQGDVVKVVEVSPDAVDGRIRARIEQPGGWISLSNQLARSRQQFAVSQHDLIACWFASHPPLEQCKAEEDAERMIGQEEAAPVQAFEESDQEEVPFNRPVPKQMPFNRPAPRRYAPDAGSSSTAPRPGCPERLLGEWEGPAKEVYIIFIEGNKWFCFRRGHPRDPDKRFPLRWNPADCTMYWGYSYGCWLAGAEVQLDQVSWHSIGCRKRSFTWTRLLEPETALDPGSAEDCHVDDFARDDGREDGGIADTSELQDEDGIEEVKEEID